MTNPNNPLGIKMLATGPDEEDEAWIRLDLLSEDEVERLRAENLEVNDGEQSGSAPPGNKDATEASRKLMEEALENPIDEVPTSPSDALG